MNTNQEARSGTENLSVVVERVLEGFLRPAEQAHMVPMEKDLTRAMVTITTASDEKRTLMWDDLLKTGSFSVRVIGSICSRYTRHTEAGARLMLAMICETPADASMYLAYAHWRCREEGRSVLDYDGFINRFHSGFWSRADLGALWDGQKLPCPDENGLDHRDVIAYLGGEAPAGTRICDRTRSEHLAWCKQRALEYVDRHDRMGALSSMAADMQKHPETRDHLAIELGSRMIMAGQLQSEREVRRWIEGFN